VRKAQAGDPRAFDRLAEALRPRIRRWANAHVGSADDAEDIAQDVLLKVHRTLGDFGFGSRFTTWLYSITRRAAADFHRKRGRRTRLFEARTDMAPTAHMPANTLDRDALSALVQRAFRALPNRQREVFDLADLQGIPLTEVAITLNMNPVTARVHLHRARTAIRSRVLQQHAALVEDFNEPQ
jgi:RNA polymerase sigma factor (sigma-70 family)